MMNRAGKGLSFTRFRSSQDYRGIFRERLQDFLEITVNDTDDTDEKTRPTSLHQAFFPLSAKSVKSVVKNGLGAALLFGFVELRQFLLPIGGLGGPVGFLVDLH